MFVSVYMASNPDRVCVLFSLLTSIIKQLLLYVLCFGLALFFWEGGKNSSLAISTNCRIPVLGYKLAHGCK